VVKGPFFDVWICQGRMCTANGADAVVARAHGHVDGTSADAADRCRVLRGGCYGLCEIGPNVVVRRFEQKKETPDDAVDRLTLTEAENETVYSRVAPAEVAAILAGHLEDDEPVAALTREAREALVPPKNDVAARIRALREKRKQEG
jgi:(2Fe-2S) ferredoxin